MSFEEMKNDYIAMIKKDNRFDKDQKVSLIEVIEKTENSKELLQVSLTYGIL